MLHGKVQCQCKGEKVKMAGTTGQLFVVVGLVKHHLSAV